MKASNSRVTDMKSSKSPKKRNKDDTQSKFGTSTVSPSRRSKKDKSIKKKNKKDKVDGKSINSSNNMSELNLMLGDKSSPRSKKSVKKKDKELSSKIASMVDDINKEILRLHERDRELTSKIEQMTDAFLNINKLSPDQKLDRIRVKLVKGVVTEMLTPVNM